MKAGSVLLFTNLTPHASFVNRSEGVRWGVDLRYQALDVPNNVGESPGDVTPARDPVTMACYPPEADFVVRDTRHPENEVTSPEEFARIRERFWHRRPSDPGRGWMAGPLSSGRLSGLVDD